MITNTDNIQMLTRYNAWANKLIFEAVTNLPGDEATKDHGSLFGSIMRILNHTYIVDLIWQAHLEGREHGFTERNPKEHPTLQELCFLQQKIDQWYITHYDNLSLEALIEYVDFKLISGTHGTMTKSDILLHIVNHTTYHRGFIADMLYKMSIKPPTTDLPIFCNQFTQDNLK